MLWASNRAWRYAAQQKFERALALAKTRWDRSAAASRAASTGTALTAPVEKIRELQYAMGRADEALGAFRGIQALAKEPK
jgi:hypothetical protein